MKHHYHSPYKRTFYSFLLVSIIMIVGTVGMSVIEKMSILDSFYFMSMIATAQGSTFVPVTAFGKIFASLMSFISVGVVVASLGFLFGPFLGKLFHIGIEHMKAEIKSKEKE